MESPYIACWQELMMEPYPWVLFENGTCVIITQPGADLAGQALEILKTSGRVIDGSENGDFAIIPLEGERGWIITCHHPDIVTLVTFDEIAPDRREDDFHVGLKGRDKRQRDWEGREIVHVQVMPALVRDVG